MAFRISELCYKLGKIDEALAALVTLERTIKPADRYMMHLLRGKCYDKQKNFNSALAEFQNAREFCGENSSGEVIGNICLRLGQAQIQAGKNTEEAIVNLKKAFELLPANDEVKADLV